MAVVYGEIVNDKNQLYKLKQQKSGQFKKYTIIENIIVNISSAIIGLIAIVTNIRYNIILIIGSQCYFSHIKQVTGKERK